MTLKYYILVNETLLYICNGKIIMWKWVRNKNNYIKNHKNNIIYDKNHNKYI